jgi:outer membrane protein OmpA-like peptidoglycan-associated protein
MASAGRPMLDSVLGARTSAITDWISSSAGVKRSSVMSLLTFALPLVIGQITRYIGSTGLTASSLTNLMTGQRAFLKEIPAGLSAAMAMGDQPSRPTVGTYDTDRTDRAPIVGTYSTEESGSSWWKWALPALLLALIPLYYAMRTPTPQLAFEAPIVTVPAIPSIPIETAAVQLPAVGTTGTLATAITDLQGFSKSLQFQTNSARLMPSSREELRRVADVLTTNPTLNIKIAGYTDNVGGEARNMKLSTDRAINTMRALVKFGVDGTRMEAVGYGETNPIADNATADGRQSNRRIDISVTKQ